MTAAAAPSSAGTRAAAGDELRRIETGSSAQLVARLLRVLLPDARTVLDSTWGRGKFWDGPAVVDVVGCDIRPHGRPAVVADFTRLPFADGAFDLCVFDPPYLADAGKGSLIGARFGTYKTNVALQAAVQAGAREAWRVSRIGIVVKVMEQIHGSRLVRMSRWVEDVIPMDLYDLVYLESPGKVEDPKWTEYGPQLSVRSTATVWLVWRHAGAVHKRSRSRSAVQLELGEAVAG